MRYVIVVVILGAIVFWDAFYNGGWWMRWLVIQLNMLIRWMGF